MVHLKRVRTSTATRKDRTICLVLGELLNVDVPSSSVDLCDLTLD